MYHVVATSEAMADCQEVHFDSRAVRASTVQFSTGAAATFVVVKDIQTATEIQTWINVL